MTNGLHTPWCSLRRRLARLTYRAIDGKAFGIVEPGRKGTLAAYDVRGRLAMMRAMKKDRKVR